MKLDGISYNEAWASGKSFDEFVEGAKSLVEALPESKREQHLKNAYELLNPSKPKKERKPAKTEQDGDNNADAGTSEELSEQP